MSNTKKLWVEIEIKEPSLPLPKIENLIKTEIEERFENAQVSRVVWGPWYPSEGW